MMQRSVLRRLGVVLRTPPSQAATRMTQRSAVKVARVAVPSILSRQTNATGMLMACVGGTSAALFSTAAMEAPTQPAKELSLPTVTLYQYEPCPYCCKVKAVLDYLSIPYNVVEVNPLTKQETKAITDYKKVPVCTIDDEVVVESSVIISRLHELVAASQEPTATDGVDAEEEDKWREWIDKKLILLMPANIYRTVPEALQAFDYCLTEGKFTPMERHMSKYAGAVIMYLIAKRSKKKYGIEDERVALYEALDSWVAAVGDKRFLGGSEPNMADLSLFGVIRSVVGLDTFDALLQNTSIEPWFTRMTEAVGPSSRIRSD